MVFKDELAVIDAIKKYPKAPQWVIDARATHKELKALVTGENFKELLITKFEKIESQDRAVARKKYSKDIRDVFNRIYQPRINVFSASGGSVNDNFTSEVKKERYLEFARDYKGQKTIKQYLAEYFFDLADTDPNGLIFTEYIEDEDIYPTYKSIDDIRVYESDGQLCEFVIFEPVEAFIGSQPVMKWRVVDDKKEYCIIQRGEEYSLLEDGTFEHPFGIVPAVILSGNQKTGSEIRISNLFPIVALAEEYAIGKSRYTIYDVQCGFPDRWRYEKTCRTCHGTSKDGDGNTCGTCGGKTRDVTDINIIDFPREDDPIVTPNISGFVSPDLEWLVWKEEQLEKQEDKMDATAWGTKRVTTATNETATGRFIDVQPVMNRLSEYSNNVEWVHNQLSIFIQSWIDNAQVTDNQFYFAYGDRFIIESQDVIIDRYSKSRKDGDNVVILDKALDEVLLAKYQNNPQALDIAQKKRLVEPYVHNSIKEVNDIFGAEEAEKKVLFVKFWEQADTNKTWEELTVDFIEFVRAVNEGKQLSEIAKSKASLNKMSPLLATAVIKEMDSHEIRALVGLEGDKKVPNIPSTNRFGQ